MQEHPLGLAEGQIYVDTRLGGVKRYYLSPRKDMNMRIRDEMLHCVVFVGTETETGNGQKQVKFKGTAFFLAVQSARSNTNYFLYLVTAKHVAKKMEGKKFYIRANMQDGTSMLVQGTNINWYYHPTDETIDVAVIPVNPPKEALYEVIPLEALLTDKIMEQEGFGIGDDVAIIGLFSRLTGTTKNLPIVRMGNIAMLPDEKVHTEFGDIDAYLIEARSIGGLSGSPAFIVKEQQYGFSPWYLLGLIHGHWDVRLGEMDDVNLQEDHMFQNVNVGIAIVVPAKRILEVINQPILVENRLKATRAEESASMPVPDIYTKPSLPSLGHESKRYNFLQRLKGIFKRE
jgi:hypothetical protein